MPNEPIMPIMPTPIMPNEPNMPIMPTTYHA